MKRILLCGLLAVVGFPMGATRTPAQTQSALNPEISFIGDTRAVSSSAAEGDVDLRFEGLEVGAEGYLNPFSRASVFLGFHGGEVHVEEAYVNFTALPANLGLKGGKYLVDVGRYIPEHPHAFPFVDYPLLVTEFFTEEGYSDVGANPSYLVDAAGVPLTLSANILSGNVGEHDHGEAPADSMALETHDQAAASGSRFFRDLTYTGRASLFLTLGKSTFLDLGGSVGTWVYVPEERMRTTWYGGDFKLKWRPSRRTSFTVEGEVMVQDRDVHAHEEGAAEANGKEIVRTTPLGAFGFANYQFRRNWNVGALADYVQLEADPDEDQLGIGAFAGYSLYEESAVVRLLARRDDRSYEEEEEWTLQLQLLFGLGPHKPHQF